jgi:5-methylcytosine-specific restriction endonuclease McrA
MQESYHVTQLSFFDFIIQPAEVTGKKQCKSCEEWHDIMFFDLSSSLEKGIRKNICKKCRRDKVRERNNKPERRQKIRAYANNQYKSDEVFREKAISRSKANYNKNRQNILSKQHKKRHKNIEEFNTKQREWRNRSIEQYRTREMLYRHARKEIIYYQNALHRQKDSWKRKHKEGNIKYDALRRNIPGSFTLEQFEARCEYYGWCCYLCGRNLTEKTACIEHRIPVSRNGTNWPANLAPACRSCNSRKHAKTEKEYREWIDSFPPETLLKMGIFKRWETK